MSDRLDQALVGRWPDVLTALAGLDPSTFNGRHQPCPACAHNGIALGPGRNVDRFRWGPGDAWFCNQCGGKGGRGGGGTGIDLLMRMRNCTYAQAAAMVENHLGLQQQQQQPVRSVARRRPVRIPDPPPAGTPAPFLGRAEEQYPYGPDPANPWFWIQRTPQPPKRPGGKPGKVFVHRTWLDEQWHWPRKTDAFTSEWPAPRPLYRLPQLIAAPDAPVLVVEGERTANAAALLFPGHVVVSWCGGTAGVGHSDWQPLAARVVTLWPDNDTKGLACMAWLAGHLEERGGTVAMVTPRADWPVKWDLADAADWTPEHAAAELQQLARPWQPTPPNPPESPDGSASASNGPRFPFDLLGFDSDGLYFQPHSTGQVVRLGRGSLTGTNLVALAPYEWWEACYPGGRGGPNWTMVASDLHARQATVGIFDAARIRGRGAWWDDGRAVLHLGDRLLVDGQPQPLQLPGSRFNYQRLAAIGLPTDVAPLTDQQGEDIATIAAGFLWDVPASGLLLAGWAALAPICGALQWRPHVWLTAGKGSGKSTLLDRFLGTLLEDLAIWPEGSTTEASIRQELRCDALPVVMDEAESNEQTDRTRMQAILSLARVSSSSGRGFVGRGGAEGQAQRFVVRSMFLLCSINTALRHGADESRFAQLTMRNPTTLPEQERERHWRQLDTCLAQQITREVGHAMAARMVRLIPVVRDAVAVFRRAAAQRLGSQRQGDQYGTLLAGAWCLMHSSVPTDAEALQLIDQQNWEPYREPSGESDEHRCLQHILQAPQRVEIERLSIEGPRVHSRASVLTRTVWELVEACRRGEETGDIPAATAAAHLGRLGLRLDGDCLLISNTAEGIRRVLRETPWGASWSTVLARLDGAERRAGVRFKGLAGSSRAVAIKVFTD